MTNGLDPERFHPQYHELHAEVLARPYPVVAGQVMVSHRAVIFTPAEADAHHAAVAALAGHPEVVAEPETDGFQLLRVGEVELRIERHSEFTTFTIFAPQPGLPFADAAIDRLPEGLLDGIPGKILAAVEIACELVAALDAGTAKTMERVMELFDQERLAGGWVVERVASVWSNFRQDERGATRFLMQIHRLTSGRYGRLLQRLVEIETYRMAATLGVPVARELFPQIEVLEAKHAELLGRIGAMDDAADDLSKDLAELSGTMEKLRVRGGQRFRHTAAYARILAARVAELREEQVPGYQTLGEFFGRRLTPAWHACETADASLNALAGSVQATTGLFRARTEAISPRRSELLPTAAGLREKTEPPHAPCLSERLLGLIAIFYLAWLLALITGWIGGRGAPLGAGWVIASFVPPLAYGVCRFVKKRK